MKMTKILENVAKLLDKHPYLRNDDVDLVFAYWKLVDQVKFSKPNYPITSPATIIRHRAKLQEHGYFLPTKPEVLKKRHKQKVKMRVWLGYTPEPLEQRIGE